MTGRHDEVGAGFSDGPFQGLHRISPGHQHFRLDRCVIQQFLQARFGVPGPFPAFTGSFVGIRVVKGIAGKVDGMKQDQPRFKSFRQSFAHFNNRIGMLAEIDRAQDVAGWRHGGAFR